MTISTPERFSRRAIRGLVGMVCLGVVSGILLVGNSCQASCGDYVVPRGSHLKMPMPVKPPCNSPACRGEVPELPVPQAPVSSSPSEKPLALFGESLCLELGSPNCYWLATSEQVCSGFRSPLERPPSL
ncbi:MAG: hypothetical protein K8R36_03675 [Planctomycetales bacterium]|nr:hypothetical protein [Planctomycetales bacterium]